MAKDNKGVSSFNQLGALLAEPKIEIVKKSQPVAADIVQPVEARRLDLGDAIQAFKNASSSNPRESAGFLTPVGTFVQQNPSQVMALAAWVDSSACCYDFSGLNDRKLLPDSAKPLLDVLEQRANEARNVAEKIAATAQQGDKIQPAQAALEKLARIQLRNA